MNAQAILAVFKRNLASYFGSPAGYVFICSFLLAGGLAAFWPQEFFNANAANLDQLIAFLPHILLGFIPAITMSVWADERRQGTDELLLTLPGSDLDVVVGKYLGTVAIFSASLVFSATANSIVLSYLGDPDVGLIFANYVGIWFIGLAMLATGMVASFLTANLTIAFVLGVAFNAPFALLSDWDWGITENYRDFARGVISLSGVIFFVSLSAAMLYLCAILIGRRNWIGSPNSGERASNFFVRFVATLAIGGSATFFFSNHDLIRIDTTVEELSKLSDGSVNLLSKVDGKVIIDAYVSPKEDFPEEYDQTRANLVSILRELGNRASDKIHVNFYEIESTDPIARTAEEEGILNKNRDGLFVTENGIDKEWDRDLFMGLVFKGAAQKAKLDFLYKGLPVEYEIIRNVVSVGSISKKKRIGVLTTDAPVMGEAPSGMFGFQMGPGRDPWELITELRKQYVVEAVTETSIRKPALPFSTSDVSIKDNTITLSKHGLKDGDVVKYFNGGGKTALGLANEEEYKVKRVNDDKIELEAQDEYKEWVSLEINGTGNDLQHFKDPNGYDALIAIQPSTFDNAKLDGLVEAVRAGIPTAIFEDPAPLLSGWSQGGLTGTFEPRKSPQQGNPGQQQPPPPPPEKGDISKLWDLLGINFCANPKDRLELSARALEEMEGLANVNLAPYKNIPAVVSLFSEIASAKKKAKTSLQKLNSGSKLSGEDFNIDLERIRKTVQNDQLGLPSGARNPISDFVQNITDVADKQLKGAEKRVVRDPFNPIPKIIRDEDELWGFPSEFVYGMKTQINHPSNKSLQDILFTFAGAIYDSEKGNQRSFTPLLTTFGHEDSGTTSLDNLMTPSNPFMRARPNVNPDRTRYPNADKHILAAAITQKINNGNSVNNLNAIVVADVDFLADNFYDFRRSVPAQFPLEVDNVVFALNIMDHLTGETDILDVRSKRRVQRNLVKMEEILSAAQQESAKKIKEARDARRSVENEANGKMQAALQTLLSNPTADNIQKLNAEQAKWGAVLQRVTEKAERDLRKEITKNDRERDAKIEESQEQVKFLAVFLPPIPLLLIAVFIFIKKRKAELEGAAASRVRA